MRLYREPFVWFFVLAAVSSTVAFVGLDRASPAEAMEAQRALPGPGLADVVYTGFWLIFATVDALDGSTSDSTRNSQPLPHTDDEYAAWLEEWERSSAVSPQMRELAHRACEVAAPRARHTCVAQALDAEVARRVALREKWEIALLASGAPWIAALVLLVRFVLARRR